MKIRDLVLREVRILREEPQQAQHTVPDFRSPQGAGWWEDQPQYQQQQQALQAQQPAAGGATPPPVHTVPDFQLAQASAQQQQQAQQSPYSQRPGGNLWGIEGDPRELPSYRAPQDPQSLGPPVQQPSWYKPEPGEQAFYFGDPTHTHVANAIAQSQQAYTQANPGADQVASYPYQNYDPDANRPDRQAWLQHNTQRKKDNQPQLDWDEWQAAQGQNQQSTQPGVAPGGTMIVDPSLGAAASLSPSPAQGTPQWDPTQLSDPDATNAVYRQQLAQLQRAPLGSPEQAAYDASRRQARGMPESRIPSLREIVAQAIKKQRSK
jgi:hypothetical protein